MKNIKFSRLFAAMMFVAVLSFAGCKQQPEEQVSPYAIEGTWLDPVFNQKYIITHDELKNYYSGDGASYAGNNLVVEELSETSGTIFIKATATLCPTHSDTAHGVYVYDNDAPDVGKWYAVSYKDLTETTVKFAGASKNYAAVYSDSLENAKKELTIGNGCFDWYDAFVRQ